jgi:hypothetical protein
MKLTTVALRTNGTHHIGSKTFEVMGYLAKITTRFDYVGPFDVRACSKCVKYTHYVKPIFIRVFNTLNNPVAFKEFGVRESCSNDAG